MNFTLVEQFHLGVALGILIGEGTFYAGMPGHKPFPLVQVGMAEDFAPLQLLLDTFGGRINGPYEMQKGRHNPLTFWKLSGNAIAPILLPLMFMPESRKRQQMLLWLEELEVRGWVWPEGTPRFSREYLTSPDMYPSEGRAFDAGAAGPKKRIAAPKH